MNKQVNNLSLYRRFPEYRKLEMEWFRKYDADAPKRGDEAPDFKLFDISGEKSVRLSDFRGKKPVVLIFGSFT